jgi:hypothetical protein
MKQRHPRSDVTPSGTEDSRHTMDSSAGVQDTDRKRPVIAHGGNSASGSNRQTARRSGTTLNFRFTQLSIFTDDLTP